MAHILKQPMDVNNTECHEIYCLHHPDAPLVKDHYGRDFICIVCGLVVGDRLIDFDSGCNNYDNDSASSEMFDVGDQESPLLTLSDLSTIIGHSDDIPSFSDSGGSKCQPKKNIDVVVTYALQEITNMAAKINVTRAVVDRAHLLFREVYIENKFRKASCDAVASACLYIACRQEGVHHTFKEICAVAKIGKKELTRCFTAILKVSETSVSLVLPSDFTSRFCAMLGLPPIVEEASTHIAHRAVELDVVHSGKSPVSVAAAAIFLASQASREKKSDKEICEVIGISSSTLRLTYKLLLQKASVLFPEDFEFFTLIKDLPHFS